jgi:hypothetical protein
VNVELRRGGEDEARIVENLWPLHQHDVSAFDGAVPARHLRQRRHDDAGRTCGVAAGWRGSVKCGGAGKRWSEEEARLERFLGP